MVIPIIFYIFASSLTIKTTIDMIEIERRIFLSEEIHKQEYDYVYGDKKDKIVTFSYYKPKTDKETICNLEHTYSDALKFARSRANDGRYKNFEFLIY